jgi:hypothetical protein
MVCPTNTLRSTMLARASLIIFESPFRDSLHASDVKRMCGGRGKIVKLR